MTWPRISSNDLPVVGADAVVVGPLEPQLGSGDEAIGVAVLVALLSTVRDLSTPHNGRPPPHMDSTERLSPVELRQVAGRRGQRRLKG